MGLSVPPFAIIQNPQLDVPMHDWRNPVMGPPLFFSQEVLATPSDGSDLFLKKLEPKQDIARLVIFDTWTRNVDRWAPAGFGQSNRDNLLFGPKADGTFRVYPIDHASCFVHTDWSELEGSAAVEDEEIYGLFPEFRPYLTHRSLALAVEAMLAIKPDSVRDIVNSVPSQWDMTGHIRDKLVDLIVRRAERVARFAPGLLVADPQMPLPQGGKGGAD